MQHEHQRPDREYIFPPHNRSVFSNSSNAENQAVFFCERLATYQEALQRAGGTEEAAHRLCTDYAFAKAHSFVGTEFMKLPWIGNQPWPFDRDSISKWSHALKGTACKGNMAYLYSRVSSAV